LVASSIQKIHRQSEKIQAMSVHGFVGSVSEFIQLADQNRLAQKITLGLGRSLNEMSPEYVSWQCGLQKLANDLRLASDRKAWIKDMTIICEFAFSDSRHRADAVLLGAPKKKHLLDCSTDEPLVCVIELKQWSNGSVDVNPDDANQVIANTHLSTKQSTIHPLLQARRYAESIKNSNVNLSNVLGLAYLPNLEDKSVLSRFQKGANEEVILKPHADKQLLDFLAKHFRKGEADAQPLLDESISFAAGSAPSANDDDDITTHVEDDEVFAFAEKERSELNKIKGDDSSLKGVGFYGSAKEFIRLCDTNEIASTIRSNLKLDMKETTSEFRSWREGLYRVSVLLRKADVDVEVACEVPTHAGMVDVLLCGTNSSGTASILVLELKQWSKSGIDPTDPTPWMFENGFIRALTGPGGYQNTSHPQWQAERYLRGIRNYNDFFNHHDDVPMEAVAFLPNHFDESHVTNQRYSRPSSSLYTGEDQDEFVAMLQTKFSSKSGCRTSPKRELMKILQSPPRMTKYIVDQIQDFVESTESGAIQDTWLVPSAEQQRAITSLLDAINRGQKSVHMVQGGPGTGKTIVGLFALFGHARVGSLPSIFIAGNKPTPRVLGGRVKDATSGSISDVSSMILTPGQLSFRFRDPGYELEVLIVDEAQSLNRVGLGMPPTIEEMIRRSKHVVFLYDERQNLNLQTDDKVMNTARFVQAIDTVQASITDEIQVTQHRLQIQQRSGTLSNLLPFLESLLGYEFSPVDPLTGFELHVYDTATDLRARILDLNRRSGIEAGIAASYCWSFISRKTGNEGAMDIQLDNNEFEMQWNSESGGGGPPWMLAPDRDQRVGYPPELQGQELHHVGVIMGRDLCVDNGQLMFRPEEHDWESPVFGGVKTAEGRDRKIASERDRIVDLLRNQYWILLTRGTRSLHLYSEDSDVRDFFRQYETP
jgi:DUF2075 family protein